MRTPNERIESVIRELEEQRLNLDGAVSKITNLQLELTAIVNGED
jgi:hypothetical protein